MLDEVSEGIVEVAGLLLEGSDCHFDASGLEFGDALAADLGVGVDGRDDDSGDAGGDESVGAGACASVMGARFEGYVGGCSGCAEAALCRLL